MGQREDLIGALPTAHEVADRLRDSPCDYCGARMWEPSQEILSQQHRVRCRGCGVSYTADPLGTWHLDSRTVPPHAKGLERSIAEAQPMRELRSPTPPEPTVETREVIELWDLQFSRRPQSSGGIGRRIDPFVPFEGYGWSLRSSHETPNVFELTTNKACDGVHVTLSGDSPAKLVALAQTLGLLPRVDSKVVA